MQNALSLIIVATVFMVSCKKKGGDLNTKPESKPMQYTVGGVTDITMGMHDERVIPLTIAHTEGEQIPVSVSVEGAPTNISTSFDVGKGTPPFTTVLKIRTNLTIEKAYDLNVVVRTDKDSIKKLSFKLNAIPTQCRDYLIGGRKFAGDCISGPSNNTYVSSEFKDDGKILFSEFSFKDNKGKIVTFNNIHAIVNCDDKSITVPETNYTSTSNVTYHLIISGHVYSKSNVMFKVKGTEINSGENTIDCIFGLN